MDTQFSHQYACWTDGWFFQQVSSMLRRISMPRGFRRRAFSVLMPRNFHVMIFWNALKLSQLKGSKGGVKCRWGVINFCCYLRWLGTFFFGRCFFVFVFWVSKCQVQKCIFLNAMFFLLSNITSLAIQKARWGENRKEVQWWTSMWERQVF